ncbi:transmembrane protein 14C-like [Hypomesus transpacificus]|uniref:transmembrane protein 14C-like n=1 Tax=Hypomesus transpacificus TaxID=137520 RepID=UPI001F0870E9|nr:transmembrane protein 14C-like [Hypomesus transpacificus]
MAIDWIGFCYAAFVSSGGIIGYVKAGSVVSLVAGLVFGVLAGIGAYLISQDSKNVYLWITVSCNGDEISKLLEVHASWFDGRGKCTDGGEDCYGNAQGTTSIMILGSYLWMG